ncbi:MAG: ATP-dependent Clp protease adapter ClpS [Deltaproteobacteria bacterium]|nr:ATP-dependent Clp protease adapter ClpS [Deltaproteobacteria bacterium]
MGSSGTFGKSQTQQKSRTALRPPPLFHVLMHNDDYTTMQFVVEVLQKIFSKPLSEANRIMFNVHTQGKGLCGTYPFEIAETKVSQVHSMAREAGFPLRCSLKET